MKKLVIHLFHVHENAALTGAKLADRVRQVYAEHGVELEMFVFGAAIGALFDPAQAEYRKALDALVQAGVTIHVCRQTVEMMAQVDTLSAAGYGLEYARDAFLRYANEGATVISL